MLLPTGHDALTMLERHVLQVSEKVYLNWQPWTGINRGSGVQTRPGVEVGGVWKRKLSASLFPFCLSQALTWWVQWPLEVDRTGDESSHVQQESVFESRSLSSTSHRQSRRRGCFQTLEAYLLCPGHDKGLGANELCLYAFLEKVKPVSLALQHLPGAPK